MDDRKIIIEKLQELIDETIDGATRLAIIKEATKPFQHMMMSYECAIKEIETKLMVLDREYSLNDEQNPIDSIKSRVKSLESIVEKIKRKNIDISVNSIEDSIKDIAGVRVIVNFPEDVYKIRDGLLKQDDIFLLEEKDYIKNPKKNGYRSLHLIVETPIFLSTGKKMVTVEIQIRTIAMNFWASLEHQLRYKKNIEEKFSISLTLKMLAEESASLDLRMERLKKQIYKD
ncbi:MAG: GTP pyrophosphokinase family protein [Anaeroplasmataceae bacterium]